LCLHLIFVFFLILGGIKEQGSEGENGASLLYAARFVLENLASVRALPLIQIRGQKKKKIKLDLLDF